MKTRWMDCAFTPVDGTNEVRVKLYGIRWWHPSWWAFMLPVVWRTTDAPVLTKLIMVPYLALRSGYALRRR